LPIVTDKLIKTLKHDDSDNKRFIIESGISLSDSKKEIEFNQNDHNSRTKKNASAEEASTYTLERVYYQDVGNTNIDDIDLSP
jgi:hypothetical protein